MSYICKNQKVKVFINFFSHSFFFSFKLNTTETHNFCRNSLYYMYENQNKLFKKISLGDTLNNTIVQINQFLR
jgi:hypothetical protein